MDTGKKKWVGRFIRPLLLIVLALCLIAAGKTMKISREAKGREGPGIYFKLVSLIPKGTVVEILETKKNWHKVKFEKKDVWVSGNTIEQVKKKKNDNMFNAGSFSEVSSEASPAVLTAAIKGFWTRYSRSSGGLYELPVEGFDISPRAYEAFESKRSGDVDRGRLFKKYRLKGKDKKHEIPLKREHSIGFACASKAATSPLLDNDALVSYLHEVGWYVAEATERYDTRFIFYVLDTDTINAISCPGGYIVLTTGLLSLLNDESELAALLAHEMAHVIAGHGMLQVMEDKVRIKADSAFDALDKQVGSTETEGDLVAITDRAMSIALGPKLDEYEFEADAMAIRYLARCGYDLNGIVRLLDKLKAVHDKNTDIFDLNYRNHPDFGKRMKAIAKEIRDYRRYTGKRFESSYQRGMSM